MASKARVLFAGRSAAHIPYFETILAALLQRGAAVTLLLDKEWSAGGVSAGQQRGLNEFKAQHPALNTGWSLRRADAWREPLFAARELRSYRSYLTRAETTPFYVERWRSYLSKPLRARTENPAFDASLRAPEGELALQFIEEMAPPDAGITKHLNELKPDVVLASPANMRFAEEVDYLKAAQALGIPTAIPVLSWDNLSTKGLIHVRPTKLFVWNEYQREDAERIQLMPDEVISVAGAPFFDKWFSDAADTPSRAAFCARLGFDPGRPILLYLGSSKNIAKDETWFVEQLKDQLSNSADPVLRSAQILVRPHPANADIYAKLIAKRYVVWPKEGALPETRQDFADMRATFKHADMAIGINTSGMIDSVLANVPTFSIRIPDYDATQFSSKHFRHLQQADALYLHPDMQGFLDTAAHVLAGRDEKASHRREFARRFARPRGLERPAGDVIAEEALALAGPR